MLCFLSFLFVVCASNRGEYIFILIGQTFHFVNKKDEIMDFFTRIGFLIKIKC